MGNFDFVKAVFPELHESCVKAESYIYTDPVAACFYARVAIDNLVEKLYYDVLGLRRPGADDLNGRTHNPDFMRHVGRTIIGKLDVIRRFGNSAAHDQSPDLRQENALSSVRELFHVLVWAGYHMSEHPGKVPVAAQFDPSLAKRARGLSPVQFQTLRLRTKAEREAHAKEIAERERRIAAQDKEMLDLQAKVKELQARIKEAQRANTVADTHDYHYKEDETRSALIDLQLAEAGWSLDHEHDREFKVTGMPVTPEHPSGVGFADYVLWDDDGKPLAVVEAKRTSVSPLVGQTQAQLYADCLERRFGQRPVIFTSNGNETQIWDDAAGYPPRDVRGFYTKDELRRLIERRRSKRRLSDLPFDETMDRIAGRPYQKAAIRAVDEAFDNNQRDALLVMATGTGKTRVVIALVHQLMEAGWVKNVLFLTDRVALVNQAANAFKSRDGGLGETVPVVNLLNARDREAGGRIYMSTYPTMMKLVNARDMDDPDESVKPLTFGPGFFDLVIIDEAHRSVYAKYGFLFTYFDSLLVGLTATPRNEIDRNTYRLFHLEYDENSGGVPTFAYDLDQAVRDGYLVPAKALPVGTKFMERGVTYDELSPEDQERWDSLEWDEEGNIPDSVEATDVNRILFNADTIDKVLGVLMERGLRVDDGDTLGKTIIFARNQRHAEAIKARFDIGWPEYGGTFARVITHSTRDAQQAIDDFSDPHKRPQIAISVDMLDTGIDVPEVVNLVFFKPVMSRTKYWQMIGRGTRLRPDLYGPGRNKTDFLVIDCCNNVAYFKEHLEETGGYVGVPLNERLFRLRLGLLETLDKASTEFDAFDGSDDDRTRYRAELVRTLNGIVNGMDPDGNVIARPHRQAIEDASQDTWWQHITRDKALRAAELAGLPSAFQASGAGAEGAVGANDQAAKRMDYLLYAYELGVLRATDDENEGAYAIASPARGLDIIKRQIQGVADQLRNPRIRSIPAVAACAELIDAVTSDEWWADVTVPMLETARKRLRGIARYADGGKRNAVFTDFEDTLTVGDETVDVSGGGDMAGVDIQRFRARAMAFLRDKEDSAVLTRVRTGVQLTEKDLAELERMLVEGGVGDEESIDLAARESGGLGLFIRSLVGLDRAAVQTVFARFLDGSRYNARQIEFVNLIVNELTRNGAMDAGRLYESPFSDVAADGPESLFVDGGDVNELFDILKDVRNSAIPVRRAA